MRPWHIAWVQLEGEREHRYTETVVAATPALAIEEWSKKSWIHARIDAVYDPQKDRGQKDVGFCTRRDAPCGTRNRG